MLELYNNQILITNVSLKILLIIDDVVYFKIDYYDNEGKLLYEGSLNLHLIPYNPLIDDNKQNIFIRSNSILNLDDNSIYINNV